MNSFIRSAKKRIFPLPILILGITFVFVSFYLAFVLSNLLPLKSVKRNIHSMPLAAEYIQVLIPTRRSEMIGAVAVAKSVISHTKLPVHFYFVTSAKGAPDLHYWIEGSSLRKISYEIKIFNPNLMGFNATMIELEYGEESWLEYSKFYVTELFPQVTNILICLSADVIVQGDIGQLQNVTIANNQFGAFSNDCDAMSRALSNNKKFYFNYLNLENSHLKDKKIDGKQCALNLDVMVLNMTLWRSEKVDKQLDYWYHLGEKEDIFRIKNSVPPFLIVFNNRVSTLDNSWHVRHLGMTRGTRHSRLFLEKANLLQWDGHFKPWKHKSPISDIWFNYMVSKPKNRL